MFINQVFMVAVFPPVLTAVEIEESECGEGEGEGVSRLGDLAWNVSPAGTFCMSHDRPLDLLDPS